ncbi:DNA cytosine methyltransferase [Sphingobium sp.]|uniref:DNA cytosine methyltransferase n=1 Tax=Sphingobium sp. TaxID=1912891 RepID=UPI000DB17AD1|nr:DNA cytosine methyltransferase [Sphingobium sp.]PZU63806.1 MAG: DNA methyltransferase [Sphingobium sp.]
MKLGPVASVRDIRHAHMFCGVGVGARGFNLAAPRVGNVQARFVCAGGIDNDAGAIHNFGRLTGTPGTVMDLFSRAQFIRFHGKEPPADWREAAPEDIRRVFGRTPDVVFLSAPCKGFSGLLSATQSKTDKYQALNELTLRGVWLLMEAYKDDPVPIVLFENVPRILTRGKWLLDQIIAILRGYGYSVNLDTHDCGVIGNLAQSRKRALAIARHMQKVPPFIYQPKHHRLRGVGEVIGKLPLPGDPVAGSMHRVPSLQWKTWLRLALVPAGKDWRALNDLAVVDGQLRDFGIVPEQVMHNDSLGVNRWTDPAPTITSQRAPGQGRFSVADPRPLDGWHNEALGVREWGDVARVVAGASRPHNGAHSVADPRPQQANQSYGQYGVREWADPAGTVTGQCAPGGGPNSIADPRLGRKAHSNVYRVVPFDKASIAVTSSRDAAVADPRPEGKDGYTTTKYKVTRFDEASRTVIGASTTGDGAFAVADPRPSWGNQRHQNIMRVTPYEDPAGTIPAAAHSVTGGHPCVADARREHYQTGGHYGVVAWEQTGYAVSGSACHDNGFNSVADPRELELESEAYRLPKPEDRLVCRIIATDGTWHRPFTTLDLASLQSLFDPEEIFFQEGGIWHSRMAFDLEHGSDVTKREWIGNAVPGAAARGMAETIGETILLAEQGETFRLDSRAIWVKPGALALSINNDQAAFRLDAANAGEII